MTKELSIPTVDNSKMPLEFSPIQVREDYAKKWNIHSKDFILLSKNGQPLRDTLYRVGGLGQPKFPIQGYFTLLKHVEAFYPDSITKIKTDKPHLESRWVILDKDGNERVEFKQFDSPYLVDDSVLYSIRSKYFNIETGELYGYAYSRIYSKEFVFLDTSEGVKKICKKTGTVELFSK